MSGIGGIVSPGGADPALVERMAACLAARMPGAPRTQVAGDATLVHAPLPTGDRGRDGNAPFSLDGRTWIVADARLDARDGLARALRAAGEAAAADAPAAELIVRAHRAWGDDAPAHLLGDFAYALWDADRRRLLCARDPFGVKPLFWAAAGDAFVVSSALDCVRLHAGVGDAWDEGWIADFLVHGYPQALDATAFAAVRRLPPAHTLVREDGRTTLRRWWALPADTEPLRLRGPRDYADAFVDVLRRAVTDRLPDAPASVFLSGGRDSTALAALAAEAIARGERRSSLLGLTAVYDRLMPDEERAYTAMAAEALGIPVRFDAVDDVRAFEGFGTAALDRPEPTDSALMVVEARQLAEAAAHGPVLFTGQGGDAVLRETRSRMVKLAARGRLLRAGVEAVQYAWWHRRLPRPGVRTWLRERRGARAWWVDPPAWIRPDFARRVGLQERVRSFNQAPPPPHPLRPEAVEMLRAPLWPHLFGAYDPAVTGVPVEVRHPYFDLRVVRFLLSVPPAQWYNDKGLLRIGMRGRLPPRLLGRPKTPLAGDPLELRRRVDGAGWLRGLAASSAVDAWVDRTRLSRAAGGLADAPPGMLYQDLRPLALTLWIARNG